MLSILLSLLFKNYNLILWYLLKIKFCYNFYPFSPWSACNVQVLVVLICLAESLSFISSSIRPSYRQKWMAKSRRVWYLLRTPHWLVKVKAKKSTTQGWVNCLTGVAMTLMEWYPFLVYYKITELLFVVPFIFYCRSSFSSLSDDLKAFPVFP